jgi:hypothetical protein
VVGRRPDFKPRRTGYSQGASQVEPTEVAHGERSDEKHQGKKEAKDRRRQEKEKRTGSRRDKKGVTPSKNLKQRGDGFAALTE